MDGKNSFDSMLPCIPVGWVYSSDEFKTVVFSEDKSSVVSDLTVMSDGNVRAGFTNPTHDDDLITKKYGDDNYSGGGGGGDFMADGSVPMTGNFQGGGNKITGIADGAALSDAVTVDQLSTKLGRTEMAADSAKLGGETYAYYATADHLHDDRYFQESEFINTSAGVADAGKPIVLDTTGQIDPSMLDVSVFYYVGEFTPAGGAEYPDTTGESHGAFWVVQSLGSDYTFTGGDLTGRTISNGDFMVWSAAGWSIMAGEMNPTLYYKLDGTQALTDPFAGGGQLISGIADGVAADDAATVGQLPTNTGDFMADGSVPMTGDFQGGGNLLTGIADGVASDDAATVGQLPTGVENIAVVSSLSGITTLDCSVATIFTTNLSENTVIELTNVPAVGALGITLKIIQPASGTVYTVDFPAGSSFQNRTLPVLSVGASKADVFTLYVESGSDIPDVYLAANNMGVPA